MSIHKSLYIGGALSAKRSVFTRRERVDQLMEKGELEEGNSVFGLPKVRTQHKVMSKKQLKALAAVQIEATASTDEEAESGAEAGADDAAAE